MKTRYVVLHETQNGWHVLDATDATSAEAAIRVFAEDGGNGTYAAVPERSWTQRTVKIETKTTVKLGGAA